MEVKKNVTRRNFISAMGLLGLAGACPLPTLASTEELRSEGKTILKAGPYLQAAGHDQITVRWLTNTTCYSWVEYGESSDNLDKKTHKVNAGLIEAYNTNNIIKIKKLLPGKSYHYRICSRVILDFIPNKIVYGDTYTSPVYSFTTPAVKADKVEFLVFNDIHDRPESFGDLMRYHGKATGDFVFLNGDMFNYQTDENQLVDHLLKPLTHLFASTTPFILSRGNHETRGKFARQLNNYFDGGRNSYYYSFQQGPAYIIVLDSGEDKKDDVIVYGGIVDFDAYRMEQKEWLEEEFKKKEFRKAKYKIVFSHIPLYYSGNGYGTLHCREHWGPILNKAKIDLLISGHTHKYGIHPVVEGQHNYPIVIGGGPSNGKRTVMNVKADQNTLKLEMFDDGGKMVGSLNL
ncbi:MAG TPA: metallophosphoesterase family protein [Sphingobacteriaceae bacterium]|nr:metallophosphoesterase family protein [Sphingobacteriaceae bacterium]